MQILTDVEKEYDDTKEMAKDISRMAARGWTVVGQSSYAPQKGLARTLAGGLLFFNRKPITTVTYSRLPHK
jgi:hypothetical protein